MAASAAPFWAETFWVRSSPTTAGLTSILVPFSYIAGLFPARVLGRAHAFCGSIISGAMVIL